MSLYLASRGPSQPSSGTWRGTSHTYTHYFVDDRRRFSDHEKIETAARRSPTYTTRGAPSLFSPRWRGWDPQSTCRITPLAVLFRINFPNPIVIGAKGVPDREVPVYLCCPRYGRKRLSSTQHGLGLILRETSETKSIGRGFVSGRMALTRSPRSDRFRFCPLLAVRARQVLVGAASRSEPSLQLEARLFLAERYAPMVGEYARR